MKSRKHERPRVVIVNRCFILNREGQILLLKRNSEEGKWSAGLWESPGGKLDEGQDISNALEREVVEETGLLIRSKSRLSFIDSWILSAGPYKGLPYILIFGVGELEAGEVRLSEEHTDHLWIKPDLAFDMELTPETRKALIALKPHLIAN